MLRESNGEDTGASCCRKMVLIPLKEVLRLTSGVERILKTIEHTRAGTHGDEILDQAVRFDSAPPRRLPKAVDGVGCWSYPKDPV